MTGGGGRWREMAGDVLTFVKVVRHKCVTRAADLGAPLDVPATGHQGRSGGEGMPRGTKGVRWGEAKGGMEGRACTPPPLAKGGEEGRACHVAKGSEEGRACTPPPLA